MTPALNDVSEISIEDMLTSQRSPDASSAQKDPAVLKRLCDSTLRTQRLKKFKILKFSSEIEIFKRATHQTLFSVGNSEGRD